MVEAENQEQQEERQIVATTYQDEDRWSGRTPEELKQRQEELLELAKKWKVFSERTDQFRSEKASSSGGFELRDDAQTSILRSAVGEIIGVSQTFKERSASRALWRLL